jgi:hypothetical protein
LYATSRDKDSRKSNPGSYVRLKSARRLRYKGHLCKSDRHTETLNLGLVWHSSRRREEKGNREKKDENQERKDRIEIVTARAGRAQACTSPTPEWESQPVPALAPHSRQATPLFSSPPFPPHPRSPTPARRQPSVSLSAAGHDVGSAIRTEEPR